MCLLQKSLLHTSYLGIVDNTSHEDKLPIVQPAESQFYVFTSLNIPALLSKSEAFCQADEALRSIIKLR